MDNDPGTEPQSSSDPKTKPSKSQTGEISLARRMVSLSWLKLLTVTLVTFTLAPFLAEQFMICELCSHFRFQYACVLFFVVLFLAIQKDRRFLWIAGVALIMDLLPIIPLYLQLPGTTSQANLRIITANVNSKNRNFARIVETMEMEKADVVFFQEVTPELVGFLNASLKTLPYHFEVPRDDNFGMAIYSRYELKNAQNVWMSAMIDEEKARAIGLEKVSVPCVTASIAFDNKTIKIINVHTVPPIAGYLYVWRNDYMNKVAEMASNFDGPVIVAGDFNCTTFSPTFNTFLAKAKLGDSERGFGYQATWPGPLWPLKIPIDHVLVKGRAVVIERDLLRNISSDHTPVAVSLRVD